MASKTETTAFERSIDPLLTVLLPDRAETVLSFRSSPELQARITQLAEKSTEGELTAAEREEYAGYVRANNFIAILQKQARRLLADPS